MGKLIVFRPPQDALIYGDNDFTIRVANVEFVKLAELDGPAEGLTVADVLPGLTGREVEVACCFTAGRRDGYLITVRAEPRRAEAAAA